MKNKQSWWENIFPKNPTQTMYMRFLKTPKAGLESRFTEIQQEFEERWKSPEIKTAYSEFLEPGD